MKTSESIANETAPAKSCCCTPCWTNFTEFMGKVWKAIAPCCITIAKVGADLVIKLGENEAEIRINHHTELTDAQRAALIEALKKSTDVLHEHLTTKQQVFSIPVLDEAKSAEHVNLDIKAHDEVALVGGHVGLELAHI